MHVVKILRDKLTLNSDSCSLVVINVFLIKISVYIHLSKFL